MTILTTNKYEQYPSSKWCWDLNSQPLAHESPPITTKPGLRPYNSLHFLYSVTSVPPPFVRLTFPFSVHFSIFRPLLLVNSLFVFESVTFASTYIRSI